MIRPITVHPDGSVTLRLSPVAWRWLADATESAVSKSPLLNEDAGDLFLGACEDHSSLETPSAEGVAGSTALTVCGLALIARSNLGCLVGSGLKFTTSQTSLDALRELGELGAAAVFGPDVKFKPTADSIAAHLVEVVS